MDMDYANDNSASQPVSETKATQDLIDYFCPHCGEKLFRGKVTEIKMVCSHCNTLVRSRGSNMLEVTED